MTRPLRSALITRASSLLRAGPPARPATVLNPSRFWPLETLPLATHSGQQCRGTPSHVPRESSRSASRHLHAGHRLANKRSTRQALPEISCTPRFRCQLIRFRHFNDDRLSDPHLTTLTTPFPHR